MYIIMRGNFGFGVNECKLVSHAPALSQLDEKPLRNVYHHLIVPFLIWLNMFSWHSYYSL